MTRKVWWLQLFLASLVVWLAHAILIQTGAVSKLADGGSLAAQDQSERKPIVLERRPLRFIKDPNPAFAGLAVNSDHNMLVVADENLSQVVEYDSRSNTPPTARLTEPKRIISGTNTKAEMICAIYIDPKTLEIYVTNADTQHWMPIFSPDARGNAAPSRALDIPYGHPFQITADEETQQIYMATSENSILVYRKQASGKEKPLRTIEGNNTRLEDPHGIALDTKNKLMFVSNFGNTLVKGSNGKDVYGTFKPASINVYSMDASGDAKPLRTIEGPKTLMNWPYHLAVHQERQELFVANNADNSVLVFRTSDNGDVAPIRVIKGPNTGIKYPPSISVDEKLGELYVASLGNSSVSVFPVTADGNVKPLRTIRGGPLGSVGLNIVNPSAVAYDSKRDQILVLN